MKDVYAKSSVKNRSQFRRTITAAVFAVIFLTALAAVIAAFSETDTGSTDSPESVGQPNASLPYIATSFSEGSLYREGERLFGAVFDESPDETAFALYAASGISAVIIPERFLSLVPAARKVGLECLVCCESLNDAARLLEKSTDGIYITASADGNQLGFLARDSGLTVACEQDGKTVFYKENGFTAKVVSIGGEDGAELLLDLLNEASKSSQGAVMRCAPQIKSNYNSCADCVAAVFNPSRRADMGALNVGIPYKRSFSTNYPAVWLTGGSDPRYPLTANGVEVSRTSNGLFCLRVPLEYGENKVALENGENSMSFDITRRRSVSKNTESAASGESPVGKTVRISALYQPMLYAEVPVRDNSRSFYAPDGFTDTVTERLTVKNYINGADIDVYRLSCGYYTETRYAEFTDGEPPAEATEILSVKSEMRDGWLCLDIETDGNPLFSVTADGSGATVSFLNAPAYSKTADTIPENPVFSSLNGGEGGEKAVFSLVVRENAAVLGYASSVDGRFARIRFRMPERLQDGAYPLEGINIFLDAGHSAFSGGTQGPDWPDDLKERELNYIVASAVKEGLEKLGASVTMSRDNVTDYLLDAYEVKTMYEKANADIAVSFHFNALSHEASQLSRCGVLVIYANGQGKPLAEALAGGISRYALRPLKAAGHGDYIVCHTPALPAVIVECGYLTNIFEYDWFLKPENVSCYAAAAVRSVYDYFVWQSGFYGS